MKWSSDIKWLGICLKDVYNWSFEVFWWMYNGQIFRIFCIPRRLEFSGRWRSCWKPRGLSKQSQHVYNIFTTRLLGVKSSLVPFSQASKDEGSLNSPHTVPLCCPDFDFYACNSLSICHIIRMYIVWLPLLNQQAVVSSSVCMFLHVFALHLGSPGWLLDKECHPLWSRYRMAQIELGPTNSPLRFWKMHRVFHFVF